MASISEAKTFGPPPSEPPPIKETGIIGWMLTNLFNSVGGTILTVISATLVVVSTIELYKFAFITAEWEVVTSNWVLYWIGRYPREYAWRTVAALMIVVVLGIAHAIFWKKSDTARRVLSIAWFLSFPAVWVTLGGFGESAVSTGLWSGLLLTMMLTVVGIVVSFPLGVLLALGRRSDDMPIIKGLSTVYIEVFRGVPLITILFMSQVMLPLFIGSSNIDVVIRAMAGVTIFSAAYLAENIRGGLQAIPNGQVEAAAALGLKPIMITGLIVLPQALRIVIPAIVGQFISLFKDTTLVSIITLLDLLGIAKVALTQKSEFQSHKMEAYLFLALIYFVLSYVMSSAARRIEANSSRMGGTAAL